MDTQTLSLVKIDIPMADVFENGQGAWDVQFKSDGTQTEAGTGGGTGGGAGGVTLYDLNLIEDDGPGASGGDNAWPNAASDIIKSGHQIGKVLYVEQPQALAAVLSIHCRASQSETSPLIIQINPQDQEIAQTITLQPTGLRYQSIKLDPKSIKAGDNEIVLSCDGNLGWSIHIAKRQAILQNAPERKDNPPRSFKSTDAGKSWSMQLGHDGESEGEYQIRLNLKQYAKQGEIISPVIDIASQIPNNNAIATDIQIKSLKTIAQYELPVDTAIQLSVRSGDTPVAGKTWGDWINCDDSGQASGPFARFVQWRAILTTTVATSTPELNSVVIEAQTVTQPLDWQQNVKTIGYHNEQILHTSIPFEYEKYDEPALAALREKYKLDDVVDGAETELQKMIKLRNWVAKQWKYDPPTPSYYPAWDAEQIIQGRQGFCVHYAIVYMQCALSLGMQTRFVFGNFPETSVNNHSVSGHEVTEYWSNQYGKWIMIDPEQNELYIDRQTKIPSSMLQLHEESVKLYFGDKPLIYDGVNLPAKLQSPNLMKWKGADPSPDEKNPEMAIKWGTVRWLPRNNFYYRPYPQPLTQGIATWPYTGYWQWQDEQTPREYRFKRYTNRHSDINWTINQVRFAATYSDQPGDINITMGTVTPDFDTYLVKINNGDFQASGDTFKWTLNPGTNRIEMRIRNRAGVLGCISHLEVQYDSK